MLLRSLAAGLICLLAMPGYSQAPPKESGQGASTEESATIPLALVDRLFEMAEHDDDRHVRRVALDTCSRLPDQQPRFAATIDRMLDSPERTVRVDAVKLLNRVDLPAERIVSAAIRHLRDLYLERNVIHYDPPLVRDLLQQHSDLAISMIAEHLTGHGDLPVLYLDMADACEIDVEQHQSLLLEYSSSDDAAVRHRLAELLSNGLARAEQAESTRDSTADKYLAYARRIVARYDQDASGSLKQEEWAKMLVDPSSADSNEDGEITVQEYCDFLIKRKN